MFIVQRDNRQIATYARGRDQTIEPADAVPEPKLKEQVKRHGGIGCVRMLHGEQGEESIKRLLFLAIARTGQHLSGNDRMRDQTATRATHG